MDYTEYVGNGIVEKLAKAVTDHGYKVVLHTGSEHSGKKLFLDKKAQVLIASSPHKAYFKTSSCGKLEKYADLRQLLTIIRD